MNKKILGYILVGLGLFSLVSSFTNLSGSLFLFLVGGIFATLYFKTSEKKGRLWALVLGLGIIGLGLFSGIEFLLGPFDGAVFFAMASAVFLTADTLHYKIYHYPKRSNWMINLSIGLIAFSGFVLFTEFFSFPAVRHISKFILPAVLIGYGLYVLIGERKLKKNN